MRHASCITLSILRQDVSYPVISVEGSCSVRELPGRWQFQAGSAGLAVVVELENETIIRFFPGTPLASSAKHSTSRVPLLVLELPRR